MKKMCKECMPKMAVVIEAGKPMKKKKDKKDPKKKEKARGKFDKVMKEYKEDKLHSGSKRGPKVKNPKQAVAIAYSEARKVYKKKK